MNGIEGDEKEYLSQNYIGLDLAGKDFSGKTFDGCSFKDCNFNEAIFNKTKFIECHFARCNLSNAKLPLSKFTDVEFDECKMVGIDWTRANWPRLSLSSPLKFYKCILNDSSFLGLSLSEIVMQACKAHDVDFREGNFSEGDFTQTDFTHSLFNRTNLSEADFTDAINYNIDVLNNDIRRAKFSRDEAVRLLDSLGIELVD